MYSRPICSCLSIKLTGLPNFPFMSRLIASIRALVPGVGVTVIGVVDSFGAAGSVTGVGGSTVTFCSTGTGATGGGGSAVSFGVAPVALVSGIFLEIGANEGTGRDAPMPAAVLLTIDPSVVFDFGSSEDSSELERSNSLILDLISFRPASSYVPVKLKNRSRRVSFSFTGIGL